MIIDGTRDEILAGAAYARKTSGDGPIVMFFAGHGVQVEGRSYLVPPDCTYWTTAYDVKREGLEVGFLIETYTMAKGSSFMLFLDACRDNPFADADWAKGARGLSAPVAHRHRHRIRWDLQDFKGNCGGENATGTGTRISFCLAGAS